MSVFVIGDLHLSLNTEKPMDIFSGWGNYTERLQKAWQDSVEPGDTVVIPGDISWAMSLDEACADFDFINKLPGQKIISKGNHDYWWTTMRKMNDWLADNSFDTIKFLHNNSFICDGFGICGTRSWFYDEDEAEPDKVFLREMGRLKMSLDSLDFSACEDAAVFLHYPPIHRSKAVEDIIGMLKSYGIKRCFYGHVHGPSIKQAFIGEYGGIDFKLISADYLKFSPYIVDVKLNSGR